MSRGAAVKAGDGAKGDHPVCTEREVEEDRGNAPATP